jgi:hypothetical protein
MGCAPTDPQQSSGGPGAFWISQGDILKIVRPFGYGDKSIQGGFWQNPSGTMLGVCDASVGVPYDVYVISETVPHVRIYKREAAYEFNEDGTPFAKFSPPGRYQLPNGTLFPAVGVLSQTACCDGIVRYVVSYDSTTGKTSVFGIADSTNPLISISDCYPLGVRSTPTKLYLFGHVVDARDKKKYRHYL